MDFLSFRFIGKSEKGFVLIMRARARPLLSVLENCFSYPFSDFPIKRKERESKDRFLGVEIRFWISRFIANPKSGFQNLNLNPNRKRP